MKQRSAQEPANARPNNYILGPIIEASYQGIVPTVEINPADTYMSGLVTYRLRLGAAETMDKIWAHSPSWSGPTKKPLSG
jgi:hypothetical protein